MRDRIICGNNIEVMRKLPDNSVDLVMTSPPYDNIRYYKGFNMDLHGVGREIHRVLKDGGICVMVIQDGTKDFGKSLTSFRTIVDWCDSFKFKLFETAIYKKHGVAGAWWSKRFRVDHEYIPIFLKGKRPQYFNKDGSKLKHEHPATFPNMLPYDVIECFCPEGGTVLDPFNGSGTTCVAAKSLNRNFIGIDVSEEYCKIARERIETEIITR